MTTGRPNTAIAVSVAKQNASCADPLPRPPHPPRRLCLDRPTPDQHRGGEGEEDQGWHGGSCTARVRSLTRQAVVAGQVFPTKPQAAVNSSCAATDSCGQQRPAGATVIGAGGGLQALAARLAASSDDSRQARFQ